MHRPVSKLNLFLSPEHHHLIGSLVYFLPAAVHGKHLQHDAVQAHVHFLGKQLL